MKTKTVKCAYCGTTKEVPLKEYTRQTKHGRISWFCNASHAAIFGNSDRKKPAVIKICKYCGKPFKSSDKTRAAVYCSRYCAGKAVSETPAGCAGSRKGGLNVEHTPAQAVRILKKREAFKYREIERALRDRGISYAFEVPLADKIFDLVLFDKKICIEFDGPNHKNKEQRRIDAQKDSIAKVAGYTMIRIPCGIKEVISPDTLKDYLES